MGEIDNKPTGETELLEEDGTVWQAGGASGALDDDDDLAMAAAPAERTTPAAPMPPYSRLPSAPQGYAMPPRAAGPSAPDWDRPVATSGETSSGRGDRTGAAGRRPSTPISPIVEPSVQVALTATTLGHTGERRRAMPMAPGRAALQPATRLAILLTLLALAIAGLIWWLTAR